MKFNFCGYPVKKGAALFYVVDLFNAYNGAFYPEASFNTLNDQICASPI